jgi:hypothetical protein
VTPVRVATVLEPFSNVTTGVTPLGRLTPLKEIESPETRGLGATDVSKGVVVDCVPTVTLFQKSTVAVTGSDPKESRRE